MGIQPDGLQRYGRPQDFNDLAEGNDPAKLIDFLKLQGQIQEDQMRRILILKATKAQLSFNSKCKQKSFDPVLFERMNCLVLKRNIWS